MNPKHFRHREHPPIRRGIGSPCGGMANMRPAGCGGDSVHGMHDDAWVKEMRRKYPESLVFRAMDDPASLTEHEMRIAVSLTGDAEIALEWVKGKEV